MYKILYIITTYIEHLNTDWIVLNVYQHELIILDLSNNDNNNIIFYLLSVLLYSKNY